MYINLTIAEFRNLKEGDSVIVNIGGNYLPAVVEDYPFYNSDADEPEWEIQLDYGFVSIDSVYKDVTAKVTSNMKLMPLEDFKKLKKNDVIAVLCNGEYLQARVYYEAFESCSLQNIMGEGDDWEVETDIGFVHNDSVYVPEE